MRRFTADQITDVKQEKIHSTLFAIQEIYPDPFRESTTIRFSIPLKTLSDGTSGNTTSLRVFDFLGREVRTLFEGEAESGSHTIHFIADNLPDGV